MQHPHLILPTPERRRFLLASGLATAMGALPTWTRAGELLRHNPFTLVSPAAIRSQTTS